MKKLHRALIITLLVSLLLPLTVLQGEIANLPAFIIDTESQEPPEPEVTTETQTITETEANASTESLETSEAQETFGTQESAETEASNETQEPNGTTRTTDATDTTETEDEKETVFQYLYRTFESTLDNQGFVIAQDLANQRESIALVWHIDAKETWRSEEVTLSDFVEHPGNAEIPLAERKIIAKHTASIADDPTELWTFENVLTKPLEIEPVELDTWFVSGMEEQTRLHPIEGTSSALKYTYNMGTLHAEDGAFDFHTLETELFPLDYKEPTIFEALPKLADFLYASRLRLETKNSTVLIRASITEELPLTPDVVRHTVQWSKTSETEDIEIRHVIDFNPNISKEDATAVLQHLEDTLPVETEGLADLWGKATAETGAGELFGDAWSARASAFGQQYSFMLTYRIEQ